MSDRTALAHTFLDSTPWARWKRNSIPGDASSRSYLRLSNGDNSIIFMDASAQNGPDTKVFADLSAFLGSAGLYPPKILAHDHSLGFLCLADLGMDDFAKWLNKHPNDATLLYQTAADVLVHLETQSTDLNLTKMTPTVGAEMVALLNPFYTQNDIRPIVAQMLDAMEKLANVPDTISLRDFHAENLIWRPDEDGLMRVGLLDFQDAFLAPAGYDLISLLRDARRGLAPDLVNDTIKYYCDMTNRSNDFKGQLSCLGVQRNLRILGVFARLAKLYKKPKYLELIPRVWSNLLLDLQHPNLATLRKVTLDILPEPSPTYLQSLRG